MAKYKKDFNANFLELIEKETQVYLARDGIASLPGFDVNYFKRISSTVKLEFAPENKEQFSIDEDVDLYVIVKNVEKL